MPDTQNPASEAPASEQGGQPSQPTHPAMQAEQKGATFESLDKDSDGRISKAEAESDAKVSQQFTRYDKNGNGFIEKDEVTSSNNSPPETPKE
jgi:Ca2+-binding EF-hand superfamily protein